MSFVCVKGETEFQKMYCGTSSGLVAGELAVFDVSTGAAVSPVIDATSSLLGVNVAGVVANTPAAGDLTVDIIPIDNQLWEYDCTSTPTTAMLGKLNDLTDSKTVANSTTISTAATAFVRNIEIAGPASDKKMRGYIVGAYAPKALS